jgi:hypothetical protein
MVDKSSRKDIIEQFKQRKIIGGIYQIRNSQNGRIWVDATADLAGSQNRFRFAQETGSAMVYRLQKDWQAMGAAVFSFAVLEELVKTESQTDAEFKADLKALKELWLEKLIGESFY